MKRPTAKRILDARNACVELETFTAGKTIEDMWSDRGLQLILRKLLEIVGEALNQASKHDPEMKVAIPNLREYVTLRNRITHGYDSVDYAIVWRVSSREIPELRAVLDELLEQAPPLRVYE